jgi:hypothetical protein
MASIGCPHDESEEKSGIIQRQTSSSHRLLSTKTGPQKPVFFVPKSQVKGGTMGRKLILTAIVFALAGCPKEPQQQITEGRLQREREQRVQAEAARDKERAGKEQWQGFTAIAIISGLVLLITGTILGSITKHDAQHHE